MSFVIATPEMLTTAATDLAKIGSTITAANTAAAAVAKVLPASADEVSVAVAALFGTHAQEYQTVSAQVATFHDRFVQTLSAAASSYVAAEAVNVEQSLLAAVNAPTQALFGRPLIGNGADGSPGTGQAGGPGGILYGNGGNGGAGGLLYTSDAADALRRLLLGPVGGHNPIYYSHITKPSHSKPLTSFTSSTFSPCN
ncbi:PE family protein, partial [Mycobacterium tuberculosis]|uniref:PE family protein n=1 Tax=Mycobacterium tuberculosis TaxID=1773 RepID=UPI00214D5AD7